MPHVSAASGNMPTHTQVIIVGAGPTGLSMAVQLLRYNIDFVIIEKNEKTTPLSKAVVVQARTLEIFDETGLADKAVKQGRLTTALNMFYNGKRKVAIDLAGLGNGLSPFSFALSLEQSKTEKLLADHIIANGKTIFWQTEVTRLTQTSDSVTAHYNDASGLEHTIQASYLVGADGAGSIVRHQLKLNFPGDTVPKIFYVTDLTLSSPVINKDELFIFLIKKGFAIFFPMEGSGHYRLIGLLPGKTDVEPGFKFESMEAEITAQMRVPVVFEEVRWFSTYKVHSREATSFVNGRCFLAGDAAHIHTPAGGQGMNTGIQDAYNLAWKMAFTIRHNAKAALLASYNTERMDNAKHLLRTTDRMFGVMAGLGWFANFIRLHVLPIIAGYISRHKMFNKYIFPLLSQTGIAYPHSALTIKSKIGKIKAGSRMPFFLLQDDSSIFSYLKDPAFKLLFFGPENPNKPLSLQTHDLPLITRSITEIPKTIFGHNTDFYILLRPDNHIIYIGKDIDKCNDFFRRWS